MNILNIEEQLSLSQTVGYTLNIDERMKLKLAHLKLMEANHDLDEVKFWGKIQAITKNYYIIIGLQYSGKYEFPHKYFFWASQDFEFKPLPELLLQHEGLSEKFNVFFSGDPNKVLVPLEGDGDGDGNQNQPDPENADGEKKEKELDEEEQEKKKVPKRNFTELHRLAHVVQAIENDAQCVPKASYRMTSEHEVSPSLHFYGLNGDNCRNLSEWLHFRSPQSSEARAKIEADNVVFSNDFLDDLCGDDPKGVWSIQTDGEKRSVNCRNLLWPGYFAFHRLESGIFGSMYMGNGIKNIDVAFMI